MKKWFAERSLNQEVGVVAVAPEFKAEAINAMMAMPFIDNVQAYTGRTKMHISFSPLVEDADIDVLRGILKRIVGDDGDPEQGYDTETE